MSVLAEVVLTSPMDRVPHKALSMSSTTQVARRLLGVVREERYSEGFWPEAVQHGYTTRARKVCPEGDSPPIHYRAPDIMVYCHRRVVCQSQFNLFMVLLTLSDASEDSRVVLFTCVALTLRKLKSQM